MTTECNSSYLDFPMVGPRQVLADFDGGDISSDGGALLLRETERLTGVIRQFAACFTDHRNPDLTEHTVDELIAQRVYALALGYEDLNDHDDLRADPLLATVVGKLDPTGKTRQRPRDRGKALAGKSTLNRLELTPVGADKDSRYKKIVAHVGQVVGW
jgi:Transposase DDE domain group 1